MRLLLIAADRMEFSGFPRSTAPPPPLALDWVCLAKMSGHDALLAANGVGAKRAAAAVDLAAASYHPDLIVSLGFCGALVPELEIADVLVADRVISGVAVYPARPIGAPSGSIHSLDRVAETAGEKARLRATGAIAVEMEAAGVASRAAALGLPFACVKTVTDLAGETLANDFNGALRPDGHFDTMVLLRSALRRPLVRLPELVRLRSRCVRAARALGDFFADCRF